MTILATAPAEARSGRRKRKKAKPKTEEIVAGLVTVSAEDRSRVLTFALAEDRKKVLRYAGGALALTGATITLTTAMEENPLAALGCTMAVVSGALSGKALGLMSTLLGALGLASLAFERDPLRASIGLGLTVLGGVLAAKE